MVATSWPTHTSWANIVIENRCGKLKHRLNSTVNIARNGPMLCAVFRDASPKNNRWKKHHRLLEDAVKSMDLQDAPSARGRNRRDVDGFGLDLAGSRRMASRSVLY